MRQAPWTVAAYLLPILSLAGLSLAGCAAAPVWLTIAAPALSYVASVNNLGAQTLKFIDDKHDACASVSEPLK